MSLLTRRQFFRRTAVAGTPLTGAMFGGAGLLRAQARANERIQMAVIGAGVRGQSHLVDLLSHPEARVSAVVDVDEARREAARALVESADGYAADDVRIYEDYRELIAAGGVDAAVIAVPNHWHALIAIACAEAGWDLYGEVPLTHSLAEGRAVCQAVQRYGRVWQTGNTLRSDPQVQRACGLVAGGRLGRVRSVEIGTLGGYVDRTGREKEAFFQDPGGLNYELWLGPAPWLPYHPGRVHENWRWHHHYGGGQLMSWIGRYGDLALWALGLDATGPVKMEAEGEFLSHQLYDVPWRYDLAATFADDLTFRISSSLAPGVRWRGDDGWIYLNENRLLASPRSLLHEMATKEEAAKARPFTAHGMDHWEDFFIGVRSRRATVASCESAQRAASLGHLGLLALYSGRSLKWDPDKETVIDDPGAQSHLHAVYREPWLLKNF